MKRMTLGSSMGVKPLYGALIEMEADLLGLPVETFKRCLEKKK